MRRFTPALWAAVLVITVGVGLTQGLSYLRSAPRFAWSTLTIEGTEHLTVEQLEHTLAGFRGQNLFAMSLSDVEDVVRAQPWVDHVHAGRRLPSGLHLEIEERKPVGLVLLGRPYLVDADGTPFKVARLHGPEAAGLPVITGIDRDWYQARPQTASALVREAVELALRWRTLERPPASEIHVTPNGFTLYTSVEGTAIKLGRAVGDELDRRLHRFDGVWASLSHDEKQRATRIHLDHTTRPDRIAVAFAER